MKQYIFALVLCTTISTIYCPPNKSNELPLTDPILRIIDGKAGIFDSTKVKNTLWLMREIKFIHNGSIKVDAQGNPNPRTGKPTDLIFGGKKQTIKSLITLEGQIDSMTPKEQAEFNALFKKVKVYFGKVNDILLADARGAQQFMIKLIREYCKKNHRDKGRNKSLLLKWDDKGGENEMYEGDIVSFTIFYVFSIDLLNFLAALIKSCPKAYAQAKAGYNKG